MSNSHNIARTSIRSYRDLIVWQRAMALVTTVYELTSAFPEEERHGLSAQMRRAAVEIPSMIAEGRSRESKDEYVQLLHQALSVVARLETHVEIVQNSSTINDLDCTEVEALLSEISKMLSVMSRRPTANAEESA